MKFVVIVLLTFCAFSSCVSPSKYTESSNEVFEGILTIERTQIFTMLMSDDIIKEQKENPVLKKITRYIHSNGSVKDLYYGYLGIEWHITSKFDNKSYHKNLDNDTIYFSNLDSKPSTKLVNFKIYSSDIKILDHDCEIFESKIYDKEGSTRYEITKFYFSRNILKLNKECFKSIYINYEKNPYIEKTGCYPLKTETEDKHGITISTVVDINKEKLGEDLFQISKDAILKPLK